MHPMRSSFSATALLKSRSPRAIQLPPARAALQEPGSPGLRVLIQVCAQEGLGFGGELRCEDDTLQVSCL